MAKGVKQKSGVAATESASSDALNQNFTMFQMIALEAMKGMLANPAVLQLDLIPAERQEMVTTASIQIAESMMIKFGCINASH